MGIGIVAYSPLGRGFFSSGLKFVENLSNDDFRKVSTSTAIVGLQNEIHNQLEWHVYSIIAAFMGVLADK